MKLILKEQGFFYNSTPLRESQKLKSRNRPVLSKSELFLHAISQSNLETTMKRG